MINYKAPSSLTADELASAEQLDIDQHFKINHGVFSVTRAAQDFYDFSPRDEATPAEDYKPSRDQRTPSVHAVLAAPSELPNREGGDEVAHYARHAGGLTLWLAHIQTFEQYTADIFTQLIQNARLDPRATALSDAEILEFGMPPQAMQNMLKEVPKVQLADMINVAEPKVVNQFIYLRNTLSTPRQQATYLPFVTSEKDPASGSNVITHEVHTTKKTFLYANRRARQLGRDIFSIYFEESFDNHRNTQHQC